MTRKRNDIDVEDVTGLSQYDGLQVLKDAHSLPGHYIRTKESLTLVSSYFDAFTVEYEDENPVEVKYYSGTKSHLTTIGFVSDVSSNLAGVYFIISSGRKDIRYAVYYTVDSVGVSPNIPGTVSLEVPISANDDASIIAYATEMVLKSLGNVFKIARKNSVLEVSTVKLGITNDTLNVGTGFTISNLAGESVLVETVNISYTNQGYPIWQSEELKGYKYNIYTGRFELLSVGGSEQLDKTASNFTISNVDVPTANTPVEVTIPDNTKRFKLQATLPNSQVKIIDKVTNDEYTVRFGSSIEFDGLDTSGLVFDVATTLDSNTIELIIWS